MGLGFNFNKSSGKQKSSSEQGVSPANRAIAFGEATRSAGDLESRITGPGGFLSNVPQLDLGSTGLTKAQESQAGFFTNLLGKSLFSKLSAGGALGGQTSQANTSSIIGSASERAAASIIPKTLELSGANQLFNTTAKQNTDVLGFEFLQNLLSIFRDLSIGGSTSSGKQKQSSFGFGFDSGANFGRGD